MAKKGHFARLVGSRDPSNTFSVSKHPVSLHYLLFLHNLTPHILPLFFLKRPVSKHHVKMKAPAAHLKTILELVTVNPVSSEKAANSVRLSLLLCGRYFKNQNEPLFYKLLTKTYLEVI